MLYHIGAILGLRFTVPHGFIMLITFYHRGEPRSTFYSAEEVFHVFTSVKKSATKSSTRRKKSKSTTTRKTKKKKKTRTKGGNSKKSKIARQKHTSVGKKRSVSDIFS
ncbi:hypothetical protein PUN28_011862 [Cardiocondyla obscurior]|uniref:Uncharacterized protein n=1 Tax=Cardiocondyla obscurior TaxID=286306 RepID=A0AAW2FKZ0_9HYME